MSIPTLKHNKLNKPMIQGVQGSFGKAKTRSTAAFFSA